MNSQTIIFVSIGALMIYLVVFALKRDYDLKTFQILLYPLVITVLGVVGTMLMYAIENLEFGGVSFFGGVLFTPLLIFPFAKLLRIKYMDALDILAPSVSIMGSIMKINCLISGCCYGKVLFYDSEGLPHRFPSQISEMIACLIITLILIALIKKRKHISMEYAIYLVIYGLIRFILNLFRYSFDSFLGMPIGNLWAINSLLIGLVIIVIWYFTKNGKLSRKVH